MLTYLATFRLRCAGGAATCPAVAVEIRDFSLRHACARAEWRLPVVAAEQGWHRARTDLVAVELVAEDDAGREPMANGDQGTEGAARLAASLTESPERARRLLAAAATVAGVAWPGTGAAR